PPPRTATTRPLKSSVPVFVRAVTSTAFGADALAPLGSQLSTMRACPDGSEAMPIQVSTSELRCSARVDIGAIAPVARSARHSPPSGAQYPGLALTSALRRVALSSTG